MKGKFLFLRPLRDSFRDLLSIILVIAFFQLVVLQQPIPNLSEILIGTLLVAIGLAMFIRGLEMGLFPIGETMAKPVLQVDPDMDNRYCARYFNRFDLSRAPVVENKQVIGIVSLTDIGLKGMVM